MKTLLTLGLLVLVCFLCHSSAGLSALKMIFKEGCCLQHNRTTVPKQKVKHVAMTSSDCRLKAVIVTTVIGKKFCIDPDWIWAKKTLKAFKKSSNSSSTL
ncbi:C-C motif chemokine 26-like [Leuresthes tenuis]|uniref:C-C motif chemokine 26-like n=1 Tax=Leuresthes tenuis TaxID=355514 RepID=UPI003B51444F